MNGRGLIVEEMKELNSLKFISFFFFTFIDICVQAVHDCRRRI
jgi:hypothetical protein